MLLLTDNTYVDKDYQESLTKLHDDFFVHRKSLSILPKVRLDRPTPVLILSDNGDFRAGYKKDEFVNSIYQLLFPVE